MGPLDAQGRRVAFVTGGTGCLGTNLVHELVAAGWHAVVLHRRTSDLRHLTNLPIALVEGDVTDPGSLTRAMPEGSDAVFHLAASLTQWGPRHAEQRRINVQGTRNVVEAARARRARRFVHTSSIAAYGEHDEVITEETPSNAERAHSNYSRTKWLAEVEVRRGIEAGLDAVIVNPSNVVGAHDRSTWSRVFFLLQEGKLPTLYPGRASWCHVREVVRAEIAAVDRGRTGANYLLGGTHAPYVEYIRIAGELLGRPVPTRMLPRPALRAIAVLAALPSHLTRREPPITPEVARVITTSSLCSSARAERELGYRPVPLREMMEDAYRWLVGEGLLPARAATLSAREAR
jgi:nucleoside-diphosphate-sugar epimerase